MKTWSDIDRRVILASQSPRRKEILSLMGITFDVKPPEGIDENSFFAPARSIEQSLSSLALAKARVVANSWPQSLVIGSDTVVVGETTVLGKPRDYDEAFVTLRALSGRTHRVCSGVALVVAEKELALSAVAETTVTFRDISPAEIRAYLNHGRYLDKAGSYAIQEEALTFVESISGCYNNIVGFPVATTIELLKKYHSLHGDSNEQ